MNPKNDFTLFDAGVEAAKDLREVFRTRKMGKRFIVLSSRIGGRIGTVLYVTRSFSVARSKAWAYNIRRPKRSLASIFDVTLETGRWFKGKRIRLPKAIQ